MGALLDGLAAGLKNLPHTKPEELPRMAGFCTWVEACAPGMGWSTGESTSAYVENRRQAASNAFEADSVAMAIVKSMATQTESAWTGTPTELLTQLNNMVSDTIKRSRAWPSTAQGLGNRMERAGPLLRRNGIGFERRHSGHRYFILFK